MDASLTGMITFILMPTLVGKKWLLATQKTVLWILTLQNLGLADERVTINWYSLPCVWERAVSLL